MSVNKVILCGNLGADPEVRTTGNGSKIVALRVATSERWKGKDGQPQERTEWHSVVILHEALAVVAESYLRKGSKLYIDGQLQTRKWTNKNGNDRYSTEVVVGVRGQLVLLDPKPESGGKAAHERSANGKAAAAYEDKFLGDDSILF